MRIRWEMTMILLSAIAAGGIAWVRTSRNLGADTAAASIAATRPADVPAPSPAGATASPVIDPRLFEDGGLGLAVQYTGTIHDPRSLVELHDSIEKRGKLGLAVLRAEMGQIHAGSDMTREEATRAVGLGKNIGLLLLYQGRFDEASQAPRYTSRTCR